MLASERLVTLTGPAGVGKSRLAVDIARRYVEGHAEAPIYVDLAAVPTDLLADGAKATAPEHEQRVLQAVGTISRHWAGLLVLDNCDHLIEATALVVEAVLADSPEATILATAREAIRVLGELPFAVSPLGVGDPSVIPPEALMRCDAVRLCADRARAAGVELTVADAPLLATICRRLDGLPLAIELAAERLGMLTPAQIVDRLDEPFLLLTGGGRSAPPRHRSLRAALDWGMERLTSSEKALLRRLSVFVSTCGLDAVEEVCEGDDVAHDEVVDLLARLIAKSLVVSEVDGVEARYRLLDPVRWYGQNELREAGEEESARDAHASWYLRLAEASETAMTDARLPVCLRTLERERGNLCKALAWSFVSGPADLGLRLATALTPYWLVRGRASEGLHWLDQALLASPAAPERLRMRGAWGQALLACRTDAYGDARSAAEGALELAREMADEGWVARSLYALGAAELASDPSGARPALHQSAETAGRADDEWCAARAMCALGLAEAMGGDLGAAGLTLGECRSRSERRGDLHGLAEALVGLGYVGGQQGDHQRAEEALREAMRLSESISDPVGSAAAATELADVEVARGRQSDARRAAAVALDLARVVGSARVLTRSLCVAATVSLRDGQAGRSGRQYEEALALAENVGLSPDVAAALIGIGEVHLALGDKDRAVDALERAVALARRSNVPLVAARALDRLGRLCHSDGHPTLAAPMHTQALALRHAAGAKPAIAESLAAIATIGAGQGGDERAARLLAAASRQRAECGICDPADCQAGEDPQLREVREHLGPEAFASAWSEGAAMSAAEAVAYALRGRGSRKRQSSGWGSLTPAERGVVRLVSEGYTNAEIGARLFISSRTVQTHLSHVFDKVGVRSRRDLARHALSPRRLQAYLGEERTYADEGGEIGRPHR